MIKASKIILTWKPFITATLLNIRFSLSVPLKLASTFKITYLLYLEIRNKLIPT